MLDRFTLHLGDCGAVLKTLPDNSVDAIVTDPPYGLGKPPDPAAMLKAWLTAGHYDVNGSGFMGKEWDAFVPQPRMWKEAFRVLKPGGHLLAFAGTRTQDLMALAIRLAGFEIRDMIAWVYGSGFPKSLDVSKAIDKAAGAKREVVGQKVYADGKTRTMGRNETMHEGWQRPWRIEDPQRGERLTAPATDAARQWSGWGTALKPSWESVTWATKPLPEHSERYIIQSNLNRLEARLWLLSSANAAVGSSTSSQSEYGAACAIAQWSADEITSTRAALCDPMGTLRFELATTTSLNIVSSWRHTLAESWGDGSTSTTETESSTTIDLRTLKFSLSQITPESIIRACSLPGGFIANATTAESHFNASLSLLQSIRTLSATVPAMSQDAESCRGAGAKPNIDPCIVARKPLCGTVAANVLEHGTGALNIDGCRVGSDGGTRAVNFRKKPDGRLERWGEQNDGARNDIEPLDGLGRWPANLIHDGSDEVVRFFPENAARFFYTAKAGGDDRDSGLYDLQPRTGGEATDRKEGSAGLDSPRAGAGRTGGRKNVHPTVKPVDLMRYLCRLITPPGGVVLDPFMGSGSTGKAAMLEGFRFVGIELGEEYFQIAKSRITSADRQAKIRDVMKRKAP